MISRHWSYPTTSLYLTQWWLTYMTPIHIFLGSNELGESTIKDMHICFGTERGYVERKNEQVDTVIVFLPLDMDSSYCPCFKMNIWKYLWYHTRSTVWSYFASMPHMHCICLRQVFISYATYNPRPLLHRTPGIVSAIKCAALTQATVLRELNSVYQGYKFDQHPPPPIGFDALSILLGFPGRIDGEI